MNTRQKEFFVERLLHFVLDVAVPWFIMVITYTPKKGLGTSKSEDTSVQIVTVHLKKTVVSGRVLSLFFLIRLTISSDYSDLTMFHMNTDFRQPFMFHQKIHNFSSKPDDQ